MHYQATILINEIKEEDLLKLLKNEIKDSKKSRSSFTITGHDNKLKIEIKSKDSTALRATFNNLTKLITVYEKCQKN